MSGTFRARRAPSPAFGGQPLPQTQRFPTRPPDMLDADQRRDAARLDPRHVPLRRAAYPPGGLRMTPGEWKLLIGICVVAVGVRLFRLSRPNSVVFDEVHFGKFASKYIKSQYYVDVHPPLAKLLLALVALIGGFDGQFDFKDIGKTYENVPYVMMRLLPATLGVGLVPLTYLTLRALDCHATTALLGSLFITFENGLITQSRHILLDSPLLFFTALAVFFWIVFSNENDKGEPFSDIWWIWLTLTGLALGAVASCKWVGLFTIATVGFCTIRQLWLLLGDLRIPPRLFLQHFAARALCLIVIPVVFYMFMFWIHFQILQNSGDGDGFMSSEFQHTLSGRGMADTFADIGIGSHVTIRHWNTQGGYLHSHAHNYPGGSKQQQITLYPHRDTNNDWIIFNVTDATDINSDVPIDFSVTSFTPITNGMHVRLHHLVTEKRLHSHDIRPPISEVDFQNEVSAYGFAGFMGDANDDWIVEIEEGDARDRESSKRLRTLHTRFKLKHALTGCYLFSHKVKLPDWGFDQQEVTCNKNAVRDNSLWYVETNTNPSRTFSRVAYIKGQVGSDADRVNYRSPGFIAKFLELQQVMWTTNAGLTDRHIYDSRPISWPQLNRGINFWVKDHRQIYLIGNPIVWFASTAAILAYVTVRGFLVLRAKRGYQDFNHSGVVKYDQLCSFLALGWALHYFPFFLMQRQLFLHHYFPALYFAVLLFCAVFDLLTVALRPRVRFQIATVLIVVTIWTYLNFSPLTYGNPWTKSRCAKAKWVKTWDFSCNDFLDDYSQYSGPVIATPSTSAMAVSTIDAPGRAPIVIADPAKDANMGKDTEGTTSFLEKAQPGRDIFAGDDRKSAESKALEIPVEEQQQAKEIRSVFQTELPSAPKGRHSDVLLPGDNAATRPASEATTSSAYKTSESQTDSLHETEKFEGKDTDSTEITVSTTEQSTAIERSAGPLGHEDAEAERVRQELFPDAARRQNA